MYRFFYTVLFTLLLPLTLLKLLWRARAQPAYLHFWAERYGFYAPRLGKARLQKSIIWLHCVSIGETMAAAPVVEALLKNYPNHQILLTHTTPTGRATSERLFNDRILRAYLPFDVPFAVDRFLTHFNPALGLLMETELWFNLIATVSSRHIPLLLVNARLSEKSARGYTKLGGLTRLGLNQLTLIAAQTEADAMRFNYLRDHPKALPIPVMGNLKFDVTPPNASLALGKSFKKILQSATPRPILLAASTRSLNGIHEEDLVLDAVKKAGIAKLLTIIVPRHPERFTVVEALLKSRGLRYARRSSLASLTSSQIDNLEVLLGDSMGELFSYYASCDVAFVGGSLLALGGQNLIEACAVGKPTIVGPHTSNFKDVVATAIERGATLRVDDVHDFAKKLNAIFNYPETQQAMKKAALAFSQQNQGATEKLLDLIKPYLPS